jgi:tripartite-type tricarboxylate transporter receptor subunit TctC
MAYRLLAKRVYAEIVCTVCERIVMRKLLLALACAAAVLTPAAASAQAYPSRPITIIAPFPAGGSLDLIARVLAEPMRVTLGQPVIVENMPGAGGNLGVGRLARAAPDGYTIGLGQWSTHVVNPITYNLPYHVINDFEPIALLTNTPQIIIARKDFPAKDAKELLAWLKANPGKATAATVGAAGGAQASSIYFADAVGSKLQFVPFRGGGPAVQEMVAGRIDLMLDQASNALGHLRAGSIKAYAVMAKERWTALPDVPTIDESGTPGLYVAYWHAMWAPKGTPKEIIAKLNAAVMQALADPNVQRRLAEQGQDVWPPAQQTPEALAAHHKAETEKWWPIIKRAGIKLQ